jgi:hypothetical protein
LAATAKNGTSQNWPMQPKIAEAKIGRYSQKLHQTKLVNAAKNGTSQNWPMQPKMAEAKIG